MYRARDAFAYRTTNEREIAAWGSAAAGASADDHSEINKWYEKNKLTGYDRAAHDVLADAYEKALDRYDLRKAFPTAESLFRQIAAKQYFLTARLLENARMSDANDSFTLAGWESTVADAQSGLVDALRHLKGDPAVIKAANAPALLVVRPHHYVIATGEPATVDVHLVNETNLHGAFLLSVAVTEDGSAKPSMDEKYPVQIAGGLRFGELLKGDVSFSPEKAGSVRIDATLVPTDAGDHPAPVLTRTETLLVVDAQPEAIKRTVSIVPGSAPIAKALEAQLGVKSVPLDESHGKPDVMLADTNMWHFEHADTATGTDDPVLYKEQSSHGVGDLVTVGNLAPGPLQVELFFAETRWDRPGQRVFDLALNGNVVLEKFDIFQEAGGKRAAAVTKKFTVDSRDGTLTISVPRVDADRALLAAFRVTDAKNKVVAQVFRAREYNGRGHRWSAATLTGFDWGPVLSGVLEKVHAGSRLVVLSSGGPDALQNATAFAQAKVLTCSGSVGQSGPSSQGFWYFGKKHWLLDGLPSNCVLDWPYQIASGDGLLLSAPGLESVVAFGRDHTVHVGIGMAVVPHGKGQVVLLDLQNLEGTFSNGAEAGFQPVTARRILYNALH
jgi:hypothetical protein